MSELSVFNFDSQAVRTLTRDGEPWFVAADVCEVLTIGNPSLAVNGRADREGSGLDEDERGIAIVNTTSGEQEVLVINESGLYSLILTSRKPEAKRFKKWVTSEVLPSIRKTGQYAAPEAYEKSFEKLDHSMRAIERISTTLDYTSDRVFEVTMRELERLGHPEWAENFIKTGQLNVGEEHIAWTKLETLAAKLAKELVKAQKSAKKRQTPFAELSPEEYAAITTEWRKKHLPYSLVTDPAHKGQATQHALTSSAGQRKLTH